MEKKFRCKVSIEREVRGRDIDEARQHFWIGLKDMELKVTEIKHEVLV